MGSFVDVLDIVHVRDHDLEQSVALDHVDKGMTAWLT